MITDFKIFENKNNASLNSWLIEYKPSKDKKKDIISKIKSIIFFAGKHIFVDDFINFKIKIDNYKEIMLKELFHEYMIVRIKELSKRFKYNYEDIEYDELVNIYNMLIVFLNHDIVYYILEFANNVYWYHNPIKEYEDVKDIIEKADWNYNYDNDYNYNDFLEILKKNEYYMNSGDINWFETIIEKYPEKYKKYLRIKNLNKFNI